MEGNLLLGNSCSYTINAIATPPQWAFREGRGRTFKKKRDGQKTAQICTAMLCQMSRGRPLWTRLLDFKHRHFPLPKPTPSSFLHISWVHKGVSWYSCSLHLYKPVTVLQCFHPCGKDPTLCRKQYWATWSAHFTQQVYLKLRYWIQPIFKPSQIRIISIPMKTYSTDFILSPQREFS